MAYVKLYRRFLASYLCVCLIPLVFSLMLIGNMRQEIQQSIAKEQETTLRNAQNNLESTLADASNTLDLLSENEQLRSLASLDTVEGENLYSLVGILRVLEAANEQRPSYVRCIAYLPQSGYLITDKSTYHPELADISTWDLGVDYKTLLDSLNNSGVSVNVQTVDPGDNGNGYLLVTKTCYDSRYKSPYAQLGILIQLEKEESFLNTDTTKMFVMENDGTFFCGSPYAQEISQPLEESETAQGSIHAGGETWIYSVYPSQNLSGLRYGLLVSSNAYYGALRTLWLQLAAELVLVIAVGVGLAVFLSRRTWSPIQKVLPFVKKSSGQDQQDYHSLTELSQALTDFAQDRERLLEQLMESEQRDYDLSLWRYLLGFTQDASCLSRYLEESQPFRMLSFSPAMVEGTPKEDVSTLMEDLYKALEHVFLDRENGVCLTIGANTVIVLVQNTVDLEEIRQKAAQVQQETGHPLVCYVSDVCSHLADAPEAWNLVKRACGQDSFWEHSRRSGVWLARELLEYPGYFKDFPLHRKQLVGALATGRPEKIQKPLETLLQEDILNNTMPIELIRHRCGSVIEVLFPYLDEENRGKAVEVISSDTAEEMRQGLLELCNHLDFPDPSAKPEEKGTLLVNQVQEFIRENYQDPFLNVSLIADKLNRNLSTLSHQYKDLTGHGLLEELHTVRLEAAKNLLKEGKTVRETAELTGYGDSRALIRAFKRYEGSTPGQYVDKK
ncbi:transcriptional regulator AraC family [Clostridium sp. CAG:1013]|nr:transcriptional regulator AraC family [Clostridium sp. CAG:1013]